VDGIFNTSAELELARRLAETGRDPGEADRLACAFSYCQAHPTAIQIFLASESFRKSWNP